MSLALENFEHPVTIPDEILSEQISKVEAEAEKMSAYEQGYQAGWDDAAQAQMQDDARISADFARNLQELSFTFFEARSHVMQSMEPLLKQLMEIFFPNLMAEATGENILEELGKIAAECADNPIEILVSPSSFPALEQLMDGENIQAVKIKKEPSLTAGQAFLRLGHVESQVDLTESLERVNGAIRSLFALNQRNLKNAG